MARTAGPASGNATMYVSVSQYIYIYIFKVVYFLVYIYAHIAALDLHTYTFM